MHIWFIEIGEPLPLEGPDARLYRYGMLTKYLAKKGHRITWWTSDFLHAKHGFVRPALRNSDRKDFIETKDGVEFRVIAGPGYKRNVSFKRHYHQLHFARRFAAEAPMQAMPDVIVCPIPTLDIATRAVELAERSGVPVLLDIRDEWPDELVDLFPKPLRPIVRLLFAPMYAQMRRICKRASGIMAISRRQFDYAMKFAGRPAGKLDGVFPLGYTKETYPPEQLESAKKYWLEMGIDPSKFIVCLFSSINNRLNLEPIFEAARILQNEFPIQFALCGHGSGFERAKTAAAAAPGVFMPGWVDGPKIAALMEIAQVGIAPYAANTRMSLPNKPFEYLSGGLPVVSSIQGELSDILRTSESGFTYGHSSTSELCEILRKLNADRNLLSVMSENALNLYRTRFAAEATFANIERHLTAAAGKTAASQEAGAGFFSNGLAGDPIQT